MATVSIVYCHSFGLLHSVYYTRLTYSGASSVRDLQERAEKLFIEKIRKILQKFSDPFFLFWFSWKSPPNQRADSEHPLDFKQKRCSSTNLETKDFSVQIFGSSLLLCAQTSDQKQWLSLELQLAACKLRFVCKATSPGRSWPRWPSRFTLESFHLNTIAFSSNRLYWIEASLPGTNRIIWAVTMK